jgi:hypothetical protein
VESFRSVFLAVFLGTALVVAAFLVNERRPAVDTDRPTAELVRATGACASCHRNETGAMVEQYERSGHHAAGVNCLQCHAPAEGQEAVEHRGFQIAPALTAANCAQCHTTQYDQFLRSRHAAPAYAAVRGPSDFSAAQVAFAEQYHPGAVDRPANALSLLEGDSAIQSGCVACHAVGRPNADGSIGTCTQCHSRHQASVALAREPRTCGPCHMGPDHSQLEIYEESKHGVLFASSHDEMNLAAPPDRLTVADMPVPTCATCHMSGLEGAGVTHDVTERLSWWLFAAESDRRPTYLQGQAAMQGICNTCHASSNTDAFYAAAEAVVADTNVKVAEATALVDALRAEGLLTAAPFDETIEFVYFDLWHYFGRTAKHGAFMGGADFVQWHGNYELLAKMVELREMAEELRASRR